MTRSIHADLLTEQKKMAYTPSFQVTFSDNNLPHPSLIKTPLSNYSNNLTASVKTTNAIIRAQRVAGVGLRVQRITNPATTSQWESWTLLDSAGNYPALFWTGSRVVIVYQNTTTMAVVFRTSDDEGQTWSSATTIWTPAYYLNGIQCGISAPSGRAAFVYANGTNLCVRFYWQSTNTFTTEYTTTLPGTLSSTSGIYLGNDAYRIALIITDYASWTDSAIAIQALTWNGSSLSWETRTTYIGIQGGTGAMPAYAFNHVSLNPIGAYFWLTFAYSAAATAGATYDDNDTFIAVSDDATFFTAGIRINQTITDRLQCHRWNDGTVYLCSDKHLFKSSQVSSVTVPTEHVKALDIQDFGPTAYAEITLDNTAGTYDDLATARLGCDVTIERGALINGTPRRCARERFAAARFTHADDGKTVTVRAYNYYRLLELWRAPFPYYYTNITLGALVEAIAALAGIHSATFDSSTIWTTTLGEFLIPPGQSAAQALASLQDQFQFLTRMGEGTTLQALVPTTNPTTAYIFGPTQHPTLRAEDSTDRVAPDITHAEVIGSNAGACSIATNVQFEMGRQFTHRITREILTSNTDCATVAQTITTKITNSINRSEITCLPAFHLQPFDAVTPPDGTTRYIASIRETYNPASLEHLPRRVKQVYRQTITLAAIAPAAGARHSINTITPEIWRRSEFRKGKLVSFDSTTWKALVWLDDSAGAVEMPVARHLHPTTLVAGRRVAVIQFDTTNPTDGLVVGVYSGTNYWQPFDRLYASDGSPAPAVYCDASGRLEADYGLDVVGTITSTAEMYPRGDKFGIMLRTTDWGYTPDVHFRSGNVIPTGYSWRGSPFGGTPTQTQYDWRNDYLRATNYPGGSTKCFLARNVTNSASSWQNKGITGRFAVGASTEIGLRLDDGTDNEYAEIYLYGTTGTVSAFFRYRLNGGTVTTVTSSVNVPASFFLLLRLYMYWSGSAYQFYGYVGHEAGEANVSGFAVSCTPGKFPAAGRVGIIVGGAGNFGYCDWLYCTFT